METSTMNFKEYVLSGEFNKDASKAVADAIADARARGLPLEGYAIVEPELESGQRAPEADDAKKKPIGLAKA